MVPLLDNALLPLRDICYLAFGLGSMAGVLYAIFSGKRKTVGDERERIVRIDTNVGETRSDVVEIKADLRAMDRRVGEMAAKLAVLENSDRKAHERLDRHSERLDELEKGKTI